MADYEYQKVTAVHRQALIDGRIHQLELQHYSLRLDLLASQDEDTATRLGSQIEAIEKSLKDLVKEAKTVDQEVSASSDK